MRVSKPLVLPLSDKNVNKKISLIERITSC